MLKVGWKLKKELVNDEKWCQKQCKEMYAGETTLQSKTQMKCSKVSLTLKRREKEGICVHFICKGEAR